MIYSVYIKSVALGVASIVLIAVVVVFCAQSAKLSVLNPLYAKAAAKPAGIVLYVVILIFYNVFYISDYVRSGEICRLLTGIFISVAYIGIIVCCILARVNNKVTEQTEDEE